MASKLEKMAQETAHVYFERGDLGMFDALNVLAELIKQAYSRKNANVYWHDGKIEIKRVPDLTAEMGLDYTANKVEAILRGLEINTGLVSCTICLDLHSATIKDVAALLTVPEETVEVCIDHEEVCREIDRYTWVGVQGCVKQIDNWAHDPLQYAEKLLYAMEEDAEEMGETVQSTAKEIAFVLSEQYLKYADHVCRIHAKDDNAQAWTAEYTPKKNKFAEWLKQYECTQNRI